MTFQIRQIRKSATQNKLQTGVNEIGLQSGAWEYLVPNQSTEIENISE